MQSWFFGKRRLGVVLGGGSTRGALQVGVIDVLVRQGIVPDLLVGTSVGALNAAFWAFNSSPEVGNRLLRIWLDQNRSTMFPNGAVHAIRQLLLRSSHITTQEGLRRMIERAMPPGARIEDASIPLAITATDIDRGNRVVLHEGPLVPAVLASAAIPALFPPVELNGHYLADGAMVANCDVATAVEAGMTDILAVDVTGDGMPDGRGGIAEPLERSILLMLRNQTELAVKATGRRARVAVLRPMLTARPGLVDFSRSIDLFELGREAAQAFLPIHLRSGLRVRPGIFEYDPLDHPTAAVGAEGEARPAPTASP